MVRLTIVCFDVGEKSRRDSLGKSCRIYSRSGGISTSSYRSHFPNDEYDDLEMTPMPLTMWTFVRLVPDP